MRAVADALKLLDPDTFHRLCFDLLVARFPGASVRSVDGAGGDKGLDVFAGELSGDLTVWQVKRFAKQPGKSQKRQIEQSLRRALQNFKPKRWYLCLPIDLSVLSLEWYENLKRKYQSRVEMDLFQSSDIVHQLIFVRRIREAYFPGVVLDIQGIKAALLRHQNFSLDDLSRLSSENVDQLVGMLEDLDPRFRYRVSFGEDCDLKPPEQSADKPVEPGLIMSRSENGMRIDAFARDVEALRLDPPRHTITFKMSAREKLERHIRTGMSVEFSEDEILGLKSSVRFPFPEGTGSGRMVLGPAKYPGRRRGFLRLTFRMGNSQVVYPLLEFELGRAGTEEIEFVSVDKALPFRMAIITRPGKGQGDFNFHAEYGGKEVRAIQKANRAVEIVRQGGRIEFFDVKNEVALGECRSPGLPLTEGHDRLTRIIDDLAIVSESFSQQILFRWEFSDQDLRTLSFLLAAITEKKIMLDVSEVSFALVKDSTKLPPVADATSGRGQFRFEFPNVQPAPIIMGCAIDTGPVAIQIADGEVLDAEATYLRYAEASDGKGILFRIKPRSETEITFLRFKPPREPSTGAN